MKKFKILFFQLIYLIKSSYRTPDFIYINFQFIMNVFCAKSIQFKFSLFGCSSICLIAWKAQVSSCTMTNNEYSIVILILKKKLNINFIPNSHEENNIIAILIFLITMVLISFSYLNANS